MIPWLIGAGIAAIAAVAIVAYWDEILDWLGDWIPKIRAAFEALIGVMNIPYGIQILAGLKFLEKMVKIMQRTYYNENGKWYQETITRELPENEVPADILAKAKKSDEADISQEMSEKLQMTI